MIALLLVFSFSCLFADAYLNKFSSFRLYSSVSDVSVSNEIEAEKVIILTPKAMSQLKQIKASKGEDMCLRMGVRAGGCSGMSYVMDLVPTSDIASDDHVEEYEGIKCVVDPKSLMFLFGLQLDYSDELIGGGFKFSNPNAEANCGCGKSFSV